VEQAYRQTKKKCNNSVYTPLVVMWLLIRQRLQGAAPLESVVLDLLQDLPSCFWPSPCKRVRDWQQGCKPVSGNTAAYNQARQKLPARVVEQSYDHMFEQLLARQTAPSAAPSRRAFVLDGTSMRLAHSPALAKCFPPAANQHGQAHWPMIRVLVAHDLQTGLAMRPEWGPMYGPETVSEQQLVERAMDRVPSGSILIGDINFGVFSVAWTATQKGHPVVLRLQLNRAKSLNGGELKDGIDRELVWTPSSNDRKRHPELPVDACVRGRLIVRQVQPDNGGKAILLALFTSLAEEVEEIVELYGQRWNIETDLRTLKSQLRMEQLSCATVEMAAKEIYMAMAAYNLVRAVIGVAAQQSGLEPRRYSFTRAARIVESFAPKIASASSEVEARQHFDRMMYFMQQAKLPKRERKTYPRSVWGKGEQYPRRNT